MAASNLGLRTLLNDTMVVILQWFKLAMFCLTTFSVYPYPYEKKKKHLQHTSPLPSTHVVEKANAFIDDWVCDRSRDVGLWESLLEECQGTK